jgi:hypothetical protein
LIRCASVCFDALLFGSLRLFLIGSASVLIGSASVLIRCASL